MHSYSTAKSYGSFHRAGVWNVPYPEDAGKSVPNSSAFFNLFSFGTSWRGMQWIKLFLLFILTFCLVAVGSAQQLAKNLSNMLRLTKIKKNVFPVFINFWKHPASIRLILYCLLLLCSTGMGMAQNSQNCNSTDSDIYSAREGALSAGFHGFVMRGSDGSFYVTGEDAQPNGSSNHRVPVKIDTSNGYSYQGNIIHAYAFGRRAYILHTDQ